MIDNIDNIVWPLSVFVSVISGPRCDHVHVSDCDRVNIVNTRDI